MAKKSKKKEDETNEVVANCDHPDEVIANCENPQETTLSQYDIEKLIVTVRGEQVLIDQDIARIYGVTTGRLNQQAKRNIARFPESFRFQLTKEERDEVIANCDNLRSLKFYPSLPYACWKDILLCSIISLPTRVGLKVTRQVLRLCFQVREMLIACLHGLDYMAKALLWNCSGNS